MHIPEFHYRKREPSFHLPLKQKQLLHAVFFLKYYIHFHVQIECTDFHWLYMYNLPRKMLNSYSHYCYRYCYLLYIWDL